ncbi:MAG: hypothetical protein CMF25_04970 [Kangiellaceae bacterium]|jgi:hypothetical protein|nr:hypothetical protein [Kangiellaceae bacterium]|tara:strand:+ start:3083 stop:3460 length:378 start_codon:yes stop_codon:yes gene_type:complete
MIGMLMVWLGTLSVYHTDLESPSTFFSVALPVFNIIYLVYLLKRFISFLYALSAHGTKSKEVDIIDLILDVFTLIYDGVCEKYNGKFAFLGSFSVLAEQTAIVVEILCVVYSFYGELQFIAELAR